MSIYKNKKGFQLWNKILIYIFILFSNYSFLKTQKHKSNFNFLYSNVPTIILRIDNHNLKIFTAYIKANVCVYIAYNHYKLSIECIYIPKNIIRAYSYKKFGRYKYYTEQSIDLSICINIVITIVQILKYSRVVYL